MMGQLRELRGARGCLRGVVHRPNAVLQAASTAVFLHGYFSSNHIGPSRLYVLMSRILAANGVSVWRFDCYGVGDSDGDFSEVTFDSELRDYRRVIAAATAEERPSDLVLVGHSMGTNMAIRLAAEVKRVSRLLLVSPTVGPVTWRHRLFSQENCDELVTRGKTVRKGIPVTKEFMDEIEDVGVYKLCEAVSARVTIIHGEHDEFYSNNNVDMLARSLKAEKVIEIPGADHNFLAGVSRMEVLAAVEDEVRSWGSG